MSWKKIFARWRNNNWRLFFRGLHWKLVVIFSLMIILAVQVISVSFFYQLQDQLIQDVEEELEAQAKILQDNVKDILQEDSAPAEKQKKLQDALQRLTIIQTREKGTRSSVEIQLLGYNGYVYASTREDSPNIGEINTRANETETRVNHAFIRRDPTRNNQDYLVLLTQIKSDEENSEPIGYVYIEASLKSVYDRIGNISMLLIESTAIALAITGLLIILLTRTITVPVKEITSQATAMAEGDFNRRVSVKSTDEIGKLAKAFNHLAAHLREALSQKEEEKRKLETVLANMTDGVIATDPDGHVIVKNQWAEKLLGQPIQIGKEINEVLPFKQPIRFPISDTNQQLIELHSDTDDERTVLQATFSPIKRGSEKMVGLIVVLSDVTEQEKLDQQRKDFVANVSHELRTPLTTIKSYLEALDDGAIEEPQLAKRFLKVTQQEADRMTRLIQDLLQLSHLDTKRVSLERKVISVREVLEDGVDRFRFQCKQKEIDLSLEIQNLLPSIFADRDKLDQLVDNIISNAVKYTPEGGSIRVTARRTDHNSVEIVIEDTGIGIPQSDLGRIFERFYRVDKARSREMGGTGLGLSIAQEIVRLHGGKIWIESEYRKGTKVFITLPTSYRR